MTLHVAVVSGSRADFGPLRPLLVGLRDDARFRLSTVVCALSSADESVRQVRAFSEAGLRVDQVVGASADTGALTMAAQAGRALEGVAGALEWIRPDLVVLLGDRFEIMASAVAAHLLRIPIVHLSGGDETLGSLDDAMRHAIARLASLHLPTNEQSAGRLRALGVPAERIETVGSTALDDLIGFTPMQRRELADSLGTELPGSLVCVTYHPATQVDEDPVATFAALLEGIRDVSPDATVVVTGSNADAGGSAIDEAARSASLADPRLTFVPSLGVERYWSLLHHADMVIGNSSSALIEAPVIGVPVVDVGARQASRLRADSCLHVAAERRAIAEGVAAALERPRSPEPSPYGDGHAVPRILQLLADIEDPTELLTPRPLLAVDR